MHAGSGEHANEDFGSAVLEWYRHQRRELPWRDIDDPYLVLVSEIMLQQTQVSRVVPKFEAFVARFPDVSTLAAAPVAEVVQAWQGLGYNRRAIALHRAAVAVVADHGGRLPADLDALLALPGIGPYTARAVLAFAFARDAAPVDTNIRRVVTRGITGTALTGRALQAAADAAVPAGSGRDWSAALMDLGSRYCGSRPRCGECPLASSCAMVVNGLPDPAAAAPRAKSVPFRSTDRYHRGRLLDALRAGTVAADAVAPAAMLHDLQRAASVANGLVTDGLAEWHDGELRLPA